MGKRADRAEIVAKLSHDLKAGRWQPGQKLPPEHELAESFGASRVTLRAALTELAADGLVTSVRRKGWYAQPDRRAEFRFLTVDSGRKTARTDVWNTWVAAQGRKGKNVLEVKREVPKSSAIVALLELEPGEECMIRSRIRLVSGEPWMLSTAYWPCWLTDGDPDMSREGRGPEVDMDDPSPLTWAALHGYPEKTITHEFDARMPMPEEVKVLEIGSSAPVLLTYTTSRGPTGRPFRCTADVFPRHRFRLMAEHEKGEE